MPSSFRSPRERRRLNVVIGLLLVLAFCAGRWIPLHSTVRAVGMAILVAVVGLSLFIYASRPLWRRMEEGEARAAANLEQRIAERTDALSRANDLLRATSDVQRGFLEESESHAYERMLDQLLVLAESSAGFVVRWKGMHAPPEPLARTYGTMGFGSEEMMALAAAVAAKGIPTMEATQGHAPTLGVPLFHGNELVGVAGLRGGAAYNYNLLYYLDPYLNACAYLLHESQLEQERAQERDTLRSILLNVQDVIFRMDMQGRLLWLSPSIETVTGYRPDELLGRNISEFVSEVAGFTRLSEALMHGVGRVTNFDVALRRRDGEVFWASSSCQYFLDERNHVVGIEGVVRDMTAYKRAEQRIEALNRLYAVLSDVNKAIVRQRNRCELYQSICRILIDEGRFCMAWIGEVDEARGRLEPIAVACAKEKCPEDLAVDLSNATGASKAIATSICERRHVVVPELADELSLVRGYRSAASFPFMVEGRVVGTLNVYADEPLYYNAENVQLLLSLAADIAYAIERLGVEKRNRDVMEDLRRVGEKLTHHMEHTPLAVVEFDDHFTIRKWNAAAERIFGFSAAEAIGCSGEIILLPESLAQARAIYAQLLEQRGGWEAVTRNRTADGRTVVCEWYNTPLTDSNGAVSGVMSAGHDVTEVVRSRDEILALNIHLEKRVEERTRELAALNHELESFSYSVSHDLRAPLRSIEGFSELLLRRNEYLDETSRDYLHRVQAASARMNGLIDDLLALSQVARAELSRERVDLSAAAQEVVEELRQSDERRKVSVKIAAGAMVCGDGRLLRVALTNLLGNAWKFTQRTAEPHIEFGVEDHNGEQVFFVRDNGAGFDMAYANKLFGPFQRLHSVQEFEGTGIGLATVQRIIARHRGRIWAEGAVNRGATFFFTLGAVVQEAAKNGKDRSRMAL